jgi:ABC-type multidrug transport system ATPase subunit
VIIGGSGQGKSVTIKVAMGLVRPDAGQVLVDGENLIGSGLKGGAARRVASCSSASASCSRARRCSTASASGRTSPSA